MGKLIHYARSTLPERRHLEQTYTWQGVPFTIAFTRFTFGFHVLFERLWEWETLIPKVTPLPQNSHFAILLHLLKQTNISILSDFEKKSKLFFDFFKKKFLALEKWYFYLKFYHTSCIIVRTCKQKPCDMACKQW